MTRRPRLLLAFLLLLCLANVATVGLSINQIMELPGLPTHLPPIYVAVMSALWAVAFGVCAFGTLILQPWTPRVISVVSVLYQLNLWVNRFAFGRSSEAFETLGFRALLTLVTLGITFGLLLWPPTRKAFRLNNQPRQLQ